MPTASITESAPRPSVWLRTDVPEVVLAEVDDVVAVLPRALQPLVDQVDADDPACSR